MSAANQPKSHLVVLHEAQQAFAQISEVLQPIAQSVVGVTTAEAALDRLRALPPGQRTVLVHWGLPELGAFKLMEQLKTLSGATSVFAFAGSWPKDDIRRALQLNVTGILVSPLKAKDVLIELLSSVRQGVSKSRQTLLKRGGLGLLAPDPTLWSLGGPAWRVRMEALVAARQLTVSPEALLRALDTASGYPLGEGEAKALYQVACGGSSTMEAVARALYLGATRLRRLVRHACETVSPGSVRPEAVPGLSSVLEGVQKLVLLRASQVVFSASFKRLRSVSSALLMIRDGDVRLDHARGLFGENLGELLRISGRYLAEMPTDAQRFIGGHVVNEMHEQLALNVARLTLLGHALRVGAGGLDVGSMNVMHVVLGCSAGARSDQLDRLVVAASRLRDQRVITTIEQADLEYLKHRLARLVVQGDGTANAVEIARRLAVIQLAVQPSGEVTQRRMADVIDALERAEEMEIPVTTRVVLARNLALPSHRRGRTALLLWETLGMLEESHEARASSFLAALNETTTFTTEDFRGLVGAVASDDALEQYQDRVDSRVASGASDAVTEGRDKAAAVSWIEALDLPPEMVNRASLSQLRETLRAPPPVTRLPPDTVERLRVLAAMLRGAPAPQQAKMLDRFKALHGDEPEMFATLSRVLDDAGEAPLRVALRAQVGLGAQLASAETVDSLLAAGNMTGAAVAVEDLGPDDPRRVPILGKLAVAQAADGQLEAAAATLEEAVKSQPRRLNLRLNLAKILLDQGRAREARPHLKVITDAAPGFANSDALWVKLRAQLRG